MMFPSWQYERMFFKNTFISHELTIRLMTGGNSVIVDCFECVQAPSVESVDELDLLSYLYPD